MIERKEYLQKLIQWKDEQVIKVVTGMRRCGKSTLLMQYQNYLKSIGVEDDQIIAINFEDLEYEELCEYKVLYDYLKERLLSVKTTYIFLDEIQKVPQFEKVVDSLYIKSDTDIYITGSNAYMLSGEELATLLSGRYLEISMLPFSFQEYCQLNRKPQEDAFADYMKFGGLPLVASMKDAPEKIDTYLEGIYNTVIIKDIEDRQNRQSESSGRRKVTDIVLLKTIAKYLASVLGSPVSIRGITNYLISSGRKISPNTVNDYLETLTESFLFYPAERFDIAGKQILTGNKKYYMADLGIRNHILPRKKYDLGFSIENVVFFELLRRGYKVAVGKYQNTEVDFVVEKQGAFTYIQVTAEMTTKDTFDREMKPLYAIRDNYEKIVLTLDKLTLGNYDGIRVIHVLDWLLKAEA